jgi:CDGSH iron-sulfur domain-containing protein 3
VIRIRLRENGPIVIESDAGDPGDLPEIFDWNGVAYEVTRTPIALCRCGASTKKPFCDGSHRTNGFVGGAPAAPIPPDSESER